MTQGPEVPSLLRVNTKRNRINRARTINWILMIETILGHASLRDLYEVSTSEVEELIEIIRDDPNVLGVRLMGGGFGGNVLALTTREHSRALVQQVEQRYYAPRNRNGIREESIMDGGS